MLANAPIIVAIPCVNLDAARVFYSETLGLSEIAMPGTEESRSLFYQCGEGSRLFVYQRETPTQADHTVANWMVEDVDAAADFLISQGITLKTYPDLPGVEYDDRGVASMGVFRTAWFTDPEGNILSIAEMP